MKYYIFDMDLGDLSETEKKEENFLQSPAFDKR
jgi:hypothetical protein